MLTHLVATLPPRVGHALARLLSRAFDVPLSLIAPWAVERPIDRARRQRVERAMRQRARRAARHGRVTR